MVIGVVEIPSTRHSYTKNVPTMRDAAKGLRHFGRLNNGIVGLDIFWPHKLHYLKIYLIEINWCDIRKCWSRNSQGNSFPIVVWPIPCMFLILLFLFIFFFRFLKPVQLFFVVVAVVFSCCRPYWTYSNVLLLFSTPPRLSKRLDNQIEGDGRTETFFLASFPRANPPTKKRKKKKTKKKRSCGSRYWELSFWYTYN